MTEHVERQDERKVICVAPDTHGTGRFTKLIAFGEKKYIHFYKSCSDKDGKSLWRLCSGLGHKGNYSEAN